MHLFSDIEVRQNLKLTLRERGKIIDRREGHNIWVNLGREYLARLISFQSFSPDVAEDPPSENRVKYMGLGIGGTRQVAPGVANTPPINPPYVGSNAQTDLDVTVTMIERPVRVGGGSTAYPGISGDVWLGQVQAPADHSVPAEVTFTKVFTQAEVSYAPFLSVPLSEIGLFTSSADPGLYQNTFIAYDTFDTVSKTVAFELEVAWTIRF